MFWLFSSIAFPAMIVAVAEVRVLLCRPGRRRRTRGRSWPRSRPATTATASASLRPLREHRRQVIDLRMDNTCPIACQAAVCQATQALVMASTFEPSGSASFRALKLRAWSEVWIRSGGCSAVSAATMTAAASWADCAPA